MHERTFQAAPSIGKPYAITLMDLTKVYEDDSALREMLHAAHIGHVVTDCTLGTSYKRIR